jgi:type I restriction enzyme M protein
MHWTEPATVDDSHAALEKTLWDAANQLWAGAALKPSEYSPTVLGLIFLRYADVRFAAVKEEIQPQAGSRRKIGPTDYHAAGVVYLPDEARFSHLLSLPESGNVGQAINEAMRAIEKENPDLADVLPKNYHILESKTLAALLKTMNSISMDKGGDTFGLIYEYFLGKFAMSEGQKGGEFYTPTSIVKLIVEILEPYHGRILDPACGSGGMFIQSARFVEAHQKNPTSEISVHGQERVTDTARLARLNLAVHGLSGDIKQGNTYYEDLQDSVGRFDFVLAKPPFNVSKIDKERLAGDPRYPFGIPRTDNGNYLWIQHFHSALKNNAAGAPGGRAGFVMANSAADARASEQQIREKIIRAGDVDVMVAIGPNFFFTVTLPCTLWFFDKGKSALPPSPPTPLPGGEGSKKGKGSAGRGGFHFQGLVEQARELRKKQTPAEEAMWELLRNRQLASRPRSTLTHSLVATPRFLGRQGVESLGQWLLSFRKCANFRKRQSCSLICTVSIRPPSVTMPTTYRPPILNCRTG